MPLAPTETSSPNVCYRDLELKPCFFGQAPCTNCPLYRACRQCSPRPALWTYIAVKCRQCGPRPAPWTAVIVKCHRHQLHLLRTCGHRLRHIWLHVQDVLLRRCRHGGCIVICAHGATGICPIPVRRQTNGTNPCISWKGPGAQTRT